MGSGWGLWGVGACSTTHPPTTTLPPTTLTTPTRPHNSQGGVAWVPVRKGTVDFVGVLAGGCFVAFDAKTFRVECTAPAGAGVFHMWANTPSKQLWVNNDIENTSTVIDLQSLETIATVPTPDDLVAAGGKPHDVIFAPSGRLAYITVLGVEGDNDYVVQYDTRTFEEIGRAAVGKDPRDVMLVKPGTLPKTSSGKLQRAKCREQYLEETLELVD